MERASGVRAGVGDDVECVKRIRGSNLDLRLCLSKCSKVVALGGKERNGGMPWAIGYRDNIEHKHTG